jgi:flagellar protein FlgJ
MSIPSSLNSSLSTLGSNAQGLASDARSVDALRSMAAKDPKAAIKETAKQFETLFMKEIMKSMRQASVSTGFLENSGSQMGTEMLDAQYSTMLSGMKGGLSEAISRQLERQMGVDKPKDEPVELKPLSLSRAASSVRPEPGGPPASIASSSPTGPTHSAAGSKPLSQTQQRQVEFVKQHTQAARAASAETGIPASFMVAQAAHESGWGRREIKMPDGSSSFNVFGIKAGPGWKGKVAEVTTTEYIQGEARKVTARFRAYDSYEDAFKDYASLIKNSPRYSRVVASSNTAEGFAQGLQKAGYATDPAYADKLARVIHTTQRLQRSVT